MSQCPCGTSLTYEECCGQFHSGNSIAETAEALMRSRYCAYVKGEIEYLVQTFLPEKRTSDYRKAAKEWSQGSEWLGLEIKKARGGKSDTDGVVEFIARFTQGGIEHAHHEISTFKKRADRWYYVDGKLVMIPGTEINVSRSAPCPCGSGKKFKRCCGASAAK